MKYLFILLIFLLAACDSTETNIKQGYETVEIDGCEYLVYEDGLLDQRVFSITHKGNCKNH